MAGVKTEHVGSGEDVFCSHSGRQCSRSSILMDGWCSAIRHETTSPMRISRLECFSFFFFFFSLSLLLLLQGRQRAQKRCSCNYSFGAHPLIACGAPCDPRASRIIVPSICRLAFVKILSLTFLSSSTLPHI